MSKWSKIPELKIEVEKEVHDKNKSWNELKLNEKENELLTAEECIWLANSKYAKMLKMDGSSYDDDFFIKQYIDLNKKKGFTARIGAGHEGINFFCNWPFNYSDPSLGVRFCKRSLK